MNQELTIEDKKDIRYIDRYLSDENLTKKQLDLLKKFDEERNKLKGLSYKTRRNYLKILRQICYFLESKNPYKTTVKDILEFLSKNSDKWKKETIASYQIAIKVFYKWLNRNEIVEEINKIRVKKTKNGFISRQDLLTQEEIKAIINQALNLRDRALLFVLFESGCRANELLNLKIKDIEIKEDYVEITIKISKTDPRIVPLINSAPDLLEWINKHPEKDNPESYVWISIYRKKGIRPIDRESFYGVIKECAKRANIKKRVWLHQARHNRITELLKMGMGETMVKKLVGLSPDSSMLARYGHLVCGDALDRLRENAGIKKLKEENIDILNIKICPRCNENNSSTSKYCNKCFVVLDVKEVTERIEKDSELMQFIEGLRYLKENNSDVFNVIRDMGLRKGVV